MSRHDASSAAELNWPVTNPWPSLILGLGLTALALILSRFPDVPWWLRVVLIVAGLISAGAAVSLRLSLARSDLDERLRSAGIVALAALAALLGCLALEPAWDSARLALAALTGVAIGGAALVLLPQTARRVAVSLLLLYHFGGILMAVTSVPPPNGQAPWMTTQIWTVFYRPYLQFMYLNNAYHFYSPDPGPPTLLWFHIEYKGGHTRWVKMPNREEFRTMLAFQRRLALTESTNMVTGLPVDFEERWHRRLQAGHGTIPQIPPYPPQLMPLTLQLRPPSPYSKLMVSSYARHVARNYPSETDPKAEVVGVKVYRVVHRIITPAELAVGQEFNDDTTYWPYYQGEFNADGELLDPEDPFLYWAIPIIRLPKEPAQPPGFRVIVPTAPRPEDMELYNFLKIHAEQVKTRKPR